MAPSPTVQADSVVSGPITQPEPIVVPASSEVPGRNTVSGPIVTSAWIQVVAGSVHGDPGELVPADDAGRSADGPARPAGPGR